MLALLPLATFVLLWCVMVGPAESLGLSVRGALVATHVLFQSLLLTLTEALSLGQHLTHRLTTLAWSLVVVILSLILLTRSGAEVGHVARRRLSDAAARVRRQPVEMWVGFSILAGIFAVLAVTGWLYRPTNTDSLVYHLTRVAHWAQDRSVAHFATHYLGQLELAPMHEYDMLHLHVLTGTDRLDGYPQLMAFGVCVAGASEVARLLGASARTQLLAAVVCAATPSLLLEATSTQNNLFGASIGISVLVLMLSWRPNGPWLGRAVLLGLSGGIAVLAKGTLPALLAPAALALGSRALVLQIRASGWPAALRRVVSTGGVLGVSALVVVTPFFARNIELFGSPAGPVSASTRVDQLGLRSGLANVLRSSAGNFRIGNGRNGFDTELSRLVVGVLRRGFNRLGVDPNDQRYEFGTQPDAFARGDFRLIDRVEEYGANPWHVVLLGLAGSAICIGALLGNRSLRLAALLAVSLALGYVIFCATVKWGVYNIRYQEPLLVAWSPLIAIALALVPPFASRIVVVLLVVACLPQLLDNEPRSLLHFVRRDQSDLSGYFPGFGTYQDGREGDYLAARDAIVASGCRRLGIANMITIEYPIWAGLHNKGWTGEIEHVDVRNESRKLENLAFRPCALIREVGPDFVADQPGEVRFGTLAITFEHQPPDHPTTAP